MKKRKLKSFVLPSLYVLTIGALFISIAFLGSSIEQQYDSGNMAVSAIKDSTIPVTNTTDEEKIVKPFTSDKVSISKNFYNMNDDESKQQQSLVYYANTYLQNSGVLYSSSESFEVISATKGTVSKVTTDEILGNVVEVTYNNNLKTVYYSLGEVLVKENDEVTTSTVLGQSGDNSLENESTNCLLFEVYQNGIAIDPNQFYDMNLKDFA